MDKVIFEDGTKLSDGYVEIDGVKHTITEAEYEGNTPLSALNLNKMQDNIEIAINDVSNNVVTELDKLEEHKYTQILTEDLTTQEITLPALYKVGAGVLDVYCNGIRLTKATNDDTEGHYYEVGETNSTSNTIKLADDWYNDTDNKPVAGDVFEFVIRGEYE